MYIHICFDTKKNKYEIFLDMSVRCTWQCLFSLTNLLTIIGSLIVSNYMLRKLIFCY